MIKIYPSPFSDPAQHEPIYQCGIEPGETLLEAVTRLVPTYDPHKPTPWSCRVGGMEVPPSRYGRAVLSAESDVSFFLTPRGGLGNIINTVLNIFTLGTWSLFVKMMSPRIPKASTQGSRDRDDMDMAAAKANMVKQGAVIREKFGSGRIYPDQLTQLRRFFVDGDPTRQACEMFLSFGRGRFQVDLARSKVGETTQAALGNNFVTRIYEPGADLSGESMADNWFTSSEVGGTSSGTAGLELNTTGAVQQNAEVSTVVLAGDTVSVPSGAGSWPEGWAAGQIIRAETPYAWTVEDSGPAVRDRITGPWEGVAPFAGMRIEVAGDFAGRFDINEVVRSIDDDSIQFVTLNFTNGEPVTELPAGTFNLSVGYEGLRFRILAISTQVMTLGRITDTGAADPDWPGFVSLNSASSRFSLDAYNTESGWSGPFAACPEGEVAHTIQPDFFYPNGLYRSNKYGNPEPYSVTVEVQYRDIAVGGAWTSRTFTHTGGVIAQAGYSPTIALGSMYRPEVRVRRITAVSTEGTISDTVQWYGLKSNMRTRKNSYEGITTAAARVFGGGALAAQSEQMISYWVTRILPYRQGGRWMPEGPTRSIAAAAMYLLKDRGYNDSRLDLAEWDRLGALWDSRGDYFDGSFEKETTAENALNVICRAGFATVIAPRGVLRPVRDAKRSEAEKAAARLYSPRNATAILRAGQPVSPNDADGVDVKWMNPVTWTVETVRCRLPELPNPRKVTEITVEGVNSRAKAWRLGMRELLTIRYRRWKTTFSTGLDSFAGNYMDYVEVADNVPELPSGGHLRYWGGGQVFMCNEPIEPGATVAVLRKPDGTKFGPHPITIIDKFTFSMAQPLDFTPIDEQDGSRMPTHIFTGTVAQQMWPCLLSSVQPSGQFRANVEALGYDERIYQFDDAEPPADA